MPARSGSAARRLSHSVLVYDNDDQLLDTAIPFLHDGISEGQPTVLCVGDSERQMIVDALGSTTGLTELPVWPPSAAFATLRSIGALAAQRPQGDGQVRLLGEVPYQDHAHTWGSWLRYEAALNHVYADLPISVLCPYDRRVAAPAVLDDIARVHPTLADTEAAGAANPDFVRPTSMLVELARRDADPVEATPPAIELVDQQPAPTRLAVAALAAMTELGRTSTEALVLAVGEVVTNAILHGRPPVVVRAWVPGDRVVVAVQDHGPGPADPFAGMIPGPSAPHGGLGLHVVYQLCTLVTMSFDPGSFTVHLTMVGDGD